MAAAATMSRRAMIMTLGACVEEDGSQSVEEACPGQSLSPVFTSGH